MKFSENLIYESHFGSKIFNKYVDNIKGLLSEIFEIDFSNLDSNKICENLNLTDYIYEVKFHLEDRNIDIHSAFSFEKDKKDLLSGVLKINEISIDKWIIECDSNNYNNIINAIMTYLEEKYDIDFTPLNLDEENKNIKNVEVNQDESWASNFTSNNHESEFFAEFHYDTGKEHVLKITQIKAHAVYLD
jgi:hypothetical protein